MAFFPDVTKGQPFKPSALLSNNVRHIVNSLNGFQNGGHASANSGIVRIQVYNAFSGEIPAGCAVNFKSDSALCGDAVPVEPLKDAAKPWGVVVLKLAANQLGDCIISGPATVKVSGSGNYAAPNVSNPSLFTCGVSGAPVLFAGNGKAVINLGASTREVYDGPFAISYDSETKKLKVAAGYLSRNGEWVNVEAKDLTPASGFICVNTTLGNGEWSKPVLKFAVPGQFNYPVGKCKVLGESVEICCFRVPVAIILVSAVCPISTTADLEE